MRRTFLELCQCFLILVLLGVTVAHSQPANKSSGVTDEKTRLTIFISDLHLGPGKDDNSNKWLRVEDFRWEKEFAEFLNWATQESKDNTDLIIVGDMLELWQSSKMKCTGEGRSLKCEVLDCEHGDKELGCTEEEAFERTDRIIKQHAPVFEALKKFATEGTNGIVILPGNHDAALIYPKVATAVLMAIAPRPFSNTDCVPGQPVCISKKGYWLSKDGLIFADHGHSFDEANHFDNWPEPFISKDGRKYLQRPFGEQMVQKYYNKYEERFPILDNLAKEWEGIRYGIETEGVTGAADDVAEFFKFFLSQISWRQRVQFLGPGEERVERPQWDVAKIKKENNVDFLINSLPPDDIIRTIAEKNKKDLKVKPADLKEEEIIMLCDYRALLRETSKGKEPAACPTKTRELGYIANKALDREEINIKDYLKKNYEATRGSNKKARAFSVYIFGHTHLAKSNQIVVRRGTWEPYILNTGAFQRIALKGQLDEIKKIKKIQHGINLEDADLLTFIQPEDLPPCYTFVRVDPYKKQLKPEAKLMYWTELPDGGWGQDEKCRWPR